MSESPDLLLVFLAARSGCEAELPSLLAVERSRWSEHGEAEAFVRIEKDPFVEFTPGMRGFDATLELRGTPEAFRAAASGVGDRFDAVVQCDLSAAVVGVDHELVAGGPAAVRYQYLMRRRHDHDHGRYLAHYGTIHAGIGTRMPGMLGYSQVHTDLSLSQEIARAGGLGGWQVDSVSRLWVNSVEEFLSQAGALGQEAVADERNFVDGANSVMFASSVLT